LKGRNVPFVKEVKYLSVIFDRKITWKCHTETIATKAFRTFVSIYFLVKSERLSAKTKLNLYKALIRSKIPYACPTWEFAVDSHLLELQRLQNRVLRTIGNLSRRTPTHALHLALQIPYVYDYVTGICRIQAEVTQKPDDLNIRNIERNESQSGIFKRLEPSGGQAYDRSSVSNATRNKNVRHNLLKDALTDRPGI
jgi:hypothetical protein